MSNKLDISTASSCLNKETTQERTIASEQLQLIFNPIRLSRRVRIDLCWIPSGRDTLMPELPQTATPASTKNPLNQPSEPRPGTHKPGEPASASAPNIESYLTDRWGACTFAVPAIFWSFPWRLNPGVLAGLGLDGSPKQSGSASRLPRCLIGHCGTEWNVL